MTSHTQTPSPEWRSDPIDTILATQNLSSPLLEKIQTAADELKLDARISHFEANGNHFRVHFSFHALPDPASYHSAENQREK